MHLNIFTSVKDTREMNRNTINGNTIKSKLGDKLISTSNGLLQKRTNNQSPDLEENKPLTRRNAIRRGEFSPDTNTTKNTQPLQKRTYSQLAGPVSRNEKKILHALDRKKLDDRLTNVTKDLSPKTHPNLYQQQHGVNRFGDIKSALETNVSQDLNANRIKISGKNIAIATQYPLTHQIEKHLKMIVKNRTPSLTVLTEQGKMNKANNGMKDYFSISGQYGDVTTESKKIESIDFDGIHANVYHLVIRPLDDADISVPVIHITNWEDYTAVNHKITNKIVEKIKKLTDESVNNYKELGSRAVVDPTKLLPVIHCRAGVGRTGQIIGAMAMKEHDIDVTLESIVTDMRNSRNGFMVQKSTQLDVLDSIAKEQGRRLIN